MSKKNEIYDYLRDEPLFRERKNKDRGIVNLLLKRYPGLKKAMEGNLTSKEALISFVQEYATLDRAWRQTLEKFPAFRGSDYGNKDELEAAKQRELGYNVPPLRP